MLPSVTHVPGQKCYPCPGLHIASPGAVAGVGDVNGDGHDDLAVGFRFEDVVRILSGEDGAVLRTISGIGTGAIQNAGDANGDGFDDLVTIEAANPAAVELVSWKLLA